MTHYKRPILGALTLALACLSAPSFAQDPTEGRAFYDQMFSHSASLDADRIPASDRLSYEQYESCLRTYRDIVDFNVNHSDEHRSLLERQEATLDEQSKLALLRMKAQESTANRAERVRLINEYDSRSQAYNHTHKVLQADLKAFLPVFSAYRENYNTFTRSCSRMYYDESHMEQLPDAFKSEFQALIKAASEKNVSLY